MMSLSIIIASEEEENKSVFDVVFFFSYCIFLLVLHWFFFWGFVIEVKQTYSFQGVFLRLSTVVDAEDTALIY